MTRYDDYYRQHAKEAEKQAQLGRNDLDLEAWRRIARDWKSLAHGHGAGAKTPSRRTERAVPQREINARHSLAPIWVSARR